MSERFGVSVYTKPPKRFGRLRGRFVRGEHVPVRRGHQPPPPRAKGVRLVRFRHLLWVVVLGGGYAATQVYGTPHLLTTYTYWGPHDSPSFSTCNYWGLHSQTVSVDGACPLFRMLDAREGRNG